MNKKSILVSMFSACCLFVVSAEAKPNDDVECFDECVAKYQPIYSSCRDIVCKHVVELEAKFCVQTCMSNK